MTIGRRRGAAAALLAVAVVGLAACSDDPEPTFASPSSSPSATESASAPAKEPWEKKTDAGAVAFAKHWMATFSRAMNSGDTSELESLSADDCETCANVVERIEEIHGNGGSHQSKGWRVLAADAVGQGKSVTVALRVLRTAERFTEGPNGPAETNPASKASMSAQLQWSASGWTMHRLDLVS